MNLWDYMVLQKLGPGKGVSRKVYLVQAVPANNLQKDKNDGNFEYNELALDDMK